MSDSDDTDVLLLIPPDFFSIDDSESISVDSYSRVCSIKSYDTSLMSKDYMLPLPIGEQYRRSELENFNEKLSRIEKNFSTPSDISSISNCTVRTNCSRRQREYDKDRDYKTCSSPVKFVHSTPKYCSHNSKTDNTVDGNGVLREIDQYLNTKADPWSKREIQNNPVALTTSGQTSLPNIKTNNYSSDSTVRRHQYYNLSNKTNENQNQLISLQELWGDGGYDASVSVQEERFRRQHCERTIKALQEKLLEYQQKISVAIQIDRTKDTAIEQLKAENQSINNQATDLHNKIQALERGKDDLSNQLRTESSELKCRNENLERELAQALDLAATFQSKNDALEVKVGELNKAYSEVENIYKRKIEDLEAKVANYQQWKKLESEKLKNIEDQFEKAQSNAETTKAEKLQLEKQYELLQGEIELLRQQKLNTYDKFREEKNRAVLLDNQNKSLQQTVLEFSEKEKTLVKELETQRISLKSHYQKQLEEVVSQKLKEFQMQLDHVEDSLRSEAKERECLIAERAIKQIELINEKNEQEIKLLTEKQHEEVELYRIQLMNASKKIDELEEKLTRYKSRRADIAEKLHGVMEAQWQKALEILTSPNPNITESTKTINLQNMDRNKLDGITNQKYQQHPENELFETPTSSRSKHYESTKARDRLHAYIELLLNKSPKDLENLDDILALKESSSDQAVKFEKSRSKTEGIFKPPWK